MEESGVGGEVKWSAVAGVVGGHEGCPGELGARVEVRVDVWEQHGADVLVELAQVLEEEVEVEIALESLATVRDGKGGIAVVLTWWSHTCECEEYCLCF